MESIEILNGGVTNNSIYFSTMNYIVTAKLDLNTKSYLLDNIIINKKYQKIRNIPIINVFFNFFKSFIIDKRGIDILSWALLIAYILDKLFFNIGLPDYIYGTYFIFLVLYANLSNIRKIHGAEHKVYNYYIKNKRISNNNIKDIKSESTSVYACGTTHCIIKLFIIFTLKLFINDFYVRFFVSEIVSYYIIYLSYRYTVVKSMFSSLFFISGIIQKILFVSEPEEIYLKMAIATINRLEQLDQM